MKLTWLAGKGEWEVVAVEQGLFFFSYFPPLKPRYVLWSGAPYSLKNTVVIFVLELFTVLSLGPFFFWSRSSC